MGLLELQKKARNKKYILSYLPQNLKDLIGDKKKIRFKNKNLKTNYLIDIIHTLLRKHLQTDKNMYNLHSTILKEKYGTFYNYYFDYLISEKLIRVSSNYWVGNKSKTYLICPKTMENIETYKNDDHFLLKKYKKIYTIGHLKKMNYKYISFDTMVKLVEYIGKVSLSYTDAENYLNSTILTKNQKIKNFHSIQCLKYNDIWYNFDPYGRFHSNLTTLKSKIRNDYLMIDGSPTQEIDITNSQPVFLTLLINNNLEQVDLEEYEFFKQLVITGQLYTYVSQHTEILERKKIKKLIYVVLFGTNHLNKKENKIFNKLFPSIFQFIKWYKKEKSDYRALAYELQRSESNLMFNNIIEDIIEKYPDTPFFTVHDSITVKQNDYKKIKEIFDDHINRLYKKL